MVDIRYYDATRQPTRNPDAVAFIAVRCQCQPYHYLLTRIGEYPNDIAMIRTWNKNMDAPTIDGSFDAANCPCHFTIEDGQYT